MPQTKAIRIRILHLNLTNINIEITLLPIASPDTTEKYSALLNPKDKTQTEQEFIAQFGFGSSISKQTHIPKNSRTLFCLFFFA